MSKINYPIKGACQCEQVAQHLTRLGIDVEPIRVDEYTGKKFTFFSDPDGLPLELYQQSEEKSAE